MQDGKNNNRAILYIGIAIVAVELFGAAYFIIGGRTRKPEPIADRPYVSTTVKCSFPDGEQGAVDVPEGWIHHKQEGTCISFCTPAWLKAGQSPGLHYPRTVDAWVNSASEDYMNVPDIRLGFSPFETLGKYKSERWAELEAAATTTELDGLDGTIRVDALKTVAGEEFDEEYIGMASIELADGSFLVADFAAPTVTGPYYPFRGDGGIVRTPYSLNEARELFGSILRTVEVDVLCGKDQYPDDCSLTGSQQEDLILPEGWTYHENKGLCASFGYPTMSMDIQPNEDKDGTTVQFQGDPDVLQTAYEYILTSVPETADTEFVESWALRRPMALSDMKNSFEKVFDNGTSVILISDLIEIECAPRSFCYVALALIDKNDIGKIFVHMSATKFAYGLDGNLYPGDTEQEIAENFVQFLRTVR